MLIIFFIIRFSVICDKFYSRLGPGLPVAMCHTQVSACFVAGGIMIRAVEQGKRQQTYAFRGEGRTALGEGDGGEARPRGRGEDQRASGPGAPLRRRRAGRCRGRRVPSRPCRTSF